MSHDEAGQPMFEIAVSVTHADDVRPRLFRHERPGGRALTLDGEQHLQHPIILSEFGGLALRAPGTWGYSACNHPEELALRYAALPDTVHRLELLSGFCYTQFADTYQEGNGLLYADRRPKFALEEMARATRGLSSPGAHVDASTAPRVEVE
jgi:hypothetical protein